VLLAEDLHVYVLVVVLVETRHGERVANPEIDGLGWLLESYPRPRYILLYVAE